MCLIISLIFYNVPSFFPDLISGPEDDLGVNDASLLHSECFEQQLCFFDRSQMCGVNKPSPSLPEVN